MRMLLYFSARYLYRSFHDLALWFDCIAQDLLAQEELAQLVNNWMVYYTEEQ